MRVGRRWNLAIALVGSLGIAVAARGVHAQKPASQVMLSSGGLNSEAGPGQAEVVSEIDDPANGDRWLLRRNEQNPAGPGQFTRIPGHALTAEGRRQAAAPEARETPMIRPGDRLVVEEHTRVADSFLEARALNPAAAGAALDVRLTIGGKVLRAVALGPGRAALQTEKGARP
jgi:hypothetical protein